MIFIDDRENGGIADLVRRLGVEVVVTRLDSGDCLFTGNGESGDCMVACERKRLTDLITSMKDRRLSKQIAEMWQRFDYCFLCIEAEFCPGPGGEILHFAYDPRTRRYGWIPYYSKSGGGRAVSYFQLDAYLNSLSLRSRGSNREPVRIKRSRNAVETAAQYVSLYRGFNDKLWYQHTAHDQVYSPAPTSGSRVGTTPRKIPPVEYVAHDIPGIDRKAELVAKYFKTPQQLCNASLDDWMKIKSDELTAGGRRKPGIAKELAAAAVKFCQEEPE